MSSAHRRVHNGDMDERSFEVGSSPEEAPRADPDAPVASPPPESDAVLARRAQILATEHWGLLAARSTAQGEVLTRITIFLTLVSAGLVTIGLLGQASGFRGWFGGASLAILAFLALIGFMTQFRVMNVSEEDMMYVVAMNRIRGAYVDLDPHVAEIFLAAIHDDEPGMKRTYSFLRRRGPSILLGSSAMLLIVVNACVVGLLSGAVVLAAGGVFPWAIAVGIVAGLLFSAGFVFLGGVGYRWAWKHYLPRRTTPPTSTR